MRSLSRCNKSHTSSDSNTPCDVMLLLFQSRSFLTSGDNKNPKLYRKTPANTQKTYVGFLLYYKLTILSKKDLHFTAFLSVKLGEATKNRPVLRTKKHVQTCLFGIDHFLTDRQTVILLSSLMLNFNEIRYNLSVLN